MNGRVRYLALAAIGIIALSGCDAAENAANKAVENAKESAAQIAKDTFSESATELSKQIDDAQESTRSWINGEKPEEEKSDDSETEETGRNEA